METDFIRLWERVTKEFFSGPIYSAHGPAHWRRVERNGLLLALHTGADVLVVRLFAVFHDSKRQNEMHDPGHGKRGAQFATELRGEYYDLTDAQFEQLVFACTWHTKEIHSEDPTIGTCWDADRLDLGRVGIIPIPEMLSTDFGKQIAIEGSIYPFLDEQDPSV